MTGWIDRLTLSQRKLVFAMIALLLVGLGAVAFQRSGRSAPAAAPADAAGARPTSAASEVALPVPAVTDDPVVVEGLNADEAPLALSDEQLAAAQAVAEGFCREYATRRWDESADARLARLQPFLSPELAAAFSTDAGGAALEDERRATREVATAQPEFAYPQTVTRDQVVFTVVVLQSISSTQGAEERRPSFQVVLEPDAAGWRVANMVA